MKLLLLCFLLVGVMEVSALVARLKRASQLSCDGDGRYRMRCNWCRCVDGNSLCTKRGCPPGLAERLKEEPDCEGSVSFKRDCNTCSCVNGRAVCTTKHCGKVDSPKDVSVTVTEDKDLAKPTPDAEAECRPGSRWRVKCNWCTCNELGFGICTKKGCPSVPTEEQMNEPVCKGNSSWKDDCNWCHCDPNGSAICTLMACVSVTGKEDFPEEVSASVMEDEVLRKPIADAEAECDPGSRWRVDCNWCTCNELGFGICTKKGCPPVPSEEQLNEPRCEGNSRWKEDCNWCHCVNGGAVCTLMECASDSFLPPPSDTPVSDPSLDENIRCTNGSRFREDCNWCTCSEAGIPICTIMDCTPEQEEISKNEPECVGESSWKKDCNWCNCLNGKAVCTLKACDVKRSLIFGTREPNKPSGPIDVLTKIERLCTNGSEWREHCNWCSCDETGNPSCTEIGCLMNPEEIDEPECRGNSEWRKDCHWCICVNGTAMCSEEDCVKSVAGIPPESTTSAECEEGSSWNEDCNTCHCKNGLITCTQMLCSLPTHCLLPPKKDDAPDCLALHLMWTYDSATASCKNIVFGGCGGTENLFKSQYDCFKSCVFPSNKGLLPGVINGSELVQRDALEQTGMQKKCLLPMDEGPCFGALPRFYYNKITGNCEKFTFGGCRGNGNRFFTLEDCQETCTGVSPPTGIFMGFA